MKTKKLMMVALVSSTLALSGCGAMSTAIKKRNLEVKTQMSETIWLEPASERTVFLQIKNTSDKDMSGLQGKIADAVKAKGYQVVTSPDKAYYWIQANVLKADKMDLRESQGWLNRGYEGAAVGAALGAGITGYNWHCCKVSDEAAFCLIQRPYISKTLLTRRISPRGSP